jgi:hypothetical protein
VQNPLWSRSVPRTVRVPNDYTEVVLKEVEADEDRNSWWVPKSKQHTIFELAFMKFVNGNLNYFDLRNMVIHANDPFPYWNPAFPNTRKVCEDLKVELNQMGPLGRMCVWKVPPKAYLEPHTDNYLYHRMITRWVYFLNLDSSSTLVRFGDEHISSNKGTLVELQPFYEKHEFRNEATTDWFFLVFDTWDMEWLSRVTRPNNDLLYQKDPKRVVYQSKH